jgi:tetratricopeptide (TPR) repeat protein
MKPPRRTRVPRRNERNFFAKLKPRNLARVAGLYAPVAWLIFQVAKDLLPILGAEKLLPGILILLAFGFIPALIFSGVFERTRKGPKRDTTVRPEESVLPQPARRMNPMIMAALILALTYFAADKFFLSRAGKKLATAAMPPSQNVKAYNAYQQGNFHLNRRTAGDFDKAIDYYTEAIRLDPRYALAHAKLSLAAASRALNFADNITAEKREALIAKSRASAERALELDPNLSEAHGAKAVVLLNVDFNYSDAEKEFRRALDLDPENLSVTANLAHLMSTLGRLEEAVALMRKAIALDPSRTGAHINLAGLLTALGRYDEAEAELHQETELQPPATVNYRRLAEIQILRGNPSKAVELAEQETDSFWHTHALALAQFANGNLVEADAALQALIDKNADDGGVQIAQVYALRKEPQKMFQWLERAWKNKDPGLTNLLSDPFLRAYKDDPRFIAFAQKIGVIPKPAGNS